MRHKFGLQFEIPPNPPAEIETALRWETEGNWWNAGSMLSAFAKSSVTSHEFQARLLTRAAGCFEAASAFREAALAYVDAVTAAHKGEHC